MTKKSTAPKKRPGPRPGPKTAVQRVRMNEDDYNVLRVCWTRSNPKGFQSFHAWLLNEMHEIAERCRKAGHKPCE